MDSFTVRVCGWVLSLWAVVVGAMMLIVSDARFSSPQWKFITGLPHGQALWGGIFCGLGILMVLGLLSNHQKLTYMSATLLGGVQIIFATILGAAAATESQGGVMGLPTFGLIGLFYLILANRTKFVS